MKNERDTFSVSFFIRRERIVNGYLPVYCYITLKGDKSKFNTKLHVPEKNWDSSSGKPKGSTIEVRELNQKLDEIKSCIFQIYHDFKISGKAFTNLNIRNKFMGIADELTTDPSDKYTLMMLFDYHQEISKNTYVKETLEHYMVSKRYFQEFLETEYKKSDIKINDLNYKFITDFETFIYKRNKRRDISKTCKNNTIMRHIIRLRKLVSIAQNNEWIDRDPFVRFKVKYTPSTRTYLTAEELERIEELEISVPRLQKVKDLFVFSCYTGLAYIDVTNLTTHNLKVGIDKEIWIHTQRQKTKNSVSIPLLDQAYNIIQKYNPDLNTKEEIPLFNVMSNQKLNAFLKEIASLCYINKELTFHVARHTFATTVTLTNGVPIESVSKMLGHTSIKTTQIYAKVVDSKICDDMNSLKNKLHSKNSNLKVCK